MLSETKYVPWAPNPTARSAPEEFSPRNRGGHVWGWLSVSPAIVLAAVSVRHPLRTPRTSKTPVRAFPGGLCISQNLSSGQWHGQIWKCGEWKAIIWFLARFHLFQFKTDTTLYFTVDGWMSGGWGTTRLSYSVTWSVIHWKLPACHAPVSYSCKHRKGRFPGGLKNNDLDHFIT